MKITQDKRENNVKTPKNPQKRNKHRKHGILNRNRALAAKKQLIAEIRSLQLHTKRLQNPVYGEKKEATGETKR